MNRPADFADAASAAIETWAARRRPDARNLAWAGKTPTRDWGLDASAWLREISEIQREFERLIGFPVPLPPAEKRRTAAFSLLKTHYVLVRKAETKSGRTMLKALLGRAVMLVIFQSFDEVAAFSPIRLICEISELDSPEPYNAR